MTEPKRDLAERVRDTRRLLDDERDIWLSTASRSGMPHLVPLSFVWTGAALILATPMQSRTARNLAEVPRCRAACGGTRDVVMLDASASVVAVVPGERTDLSDPFIRKLAWDPSLDPEPQAWLELHPHRVQAWRNVAEIDGRDLMRNGSWLA